MAAMCFEQVQRFILAGARGTLRLGNLLCLNFVEHFDSFFVASFIERCVSDFVFYRVTITLYIEKVSNDFISAA